MKKIITAALIVLLTLTACGKKDNDNVLTVALSPDYAPYEFIDPTKKGQEQYAGADVELAKFIAEQMGKTLEIVPVAFGDIPSAINLGKYDLGISGFTYEEERAKVIAFSTPYDTSESMCQGILVRTEDKDAYTSIENFNGKRIAVQNGSVQQQYAEAQLKDIDVRPITKIEDGILELKAKKVDAIAISCIVGRMAEIENPEITLATPKFDVEDANGTMVIVKKENTELLDEVNAIIEKVKTQDLYTKWLDQAFETIKEHGIKE